MTTAPFGVGRSPKPGPYVERTPRICIYDLPRSLFTPFAREGSVEQVHVVINGKAAVLDVMSDARHLGGVQWYFVCKACSRRVWHLCVRPDERLTCRRCVTGLDYMSKHTRRRGVNRIRRLREKIGALPSPLAPLPRKPPHWRRDYWARTVAKLAWAEATIAAELHGMIPRVRRRLRHEHGNRDARRT